MGIKLDLFNVIIPYRGGRVASPLTPSPAERGSAGNSLLRDNQIQIGNHTIVKIIHVWSND